MNPPAAGRIDEHPVPLVVGALATRAFTGTLRLEHDGRSWTTHWRDGAIIAGDSASPEDQLGRVALEAGLLDPTTVGESLRRMASSPGTPQIEILVAMGKLSAEDAERLVRATLARSAARMFALATATYTIVEAHAERVNGGPLDARWVIYRGLRLHYDEKRLDRELSLLGGKAIKLEVDPAAIQDAYGFADEERIVLAYLQKGYWELSDLVDACVSLARGIVLAVVYALHAGRYLDAQPADSVPRLRKRAREATQRLPREAPPAGSFLHSRPTNTESPYASVPSPPAPSAPAPSAPTPSSPAPPPKPPTNPPAQARTQQSTPSTPMAPAKPPTIPPASGIPDAVAEKLREQMLAKSRQVEAGADHFMILELDRGASKEQVRAQYFSLAKMYHPDRLALLKLEALRPQVERVFAKLSEAFGVLSDDARRKEYLKILAEGGEAAVRSKQDKEAARAVAILSAEEHFRRGEMALRRQLFPQAMEEFKKALDLNTEEAEHHAMCAWANWCCATDKEKVAPDTKKGLNRALELNPKCIPAFFYLGQVYKQLGDVDRAFAHFSKVMSLAPDHVDAAREIRVIEMRRTAGDKKGSFFDRFKKK